MGKNLCDKCKQETRPGQPRLGLWQREFLLRVQRIYQNRGVEACAWNNLHGLHLTRWSVAENRYVRSPHYNTLNRDYYNSAMKLVLAGHLMLYPRTGKDREHWGFIPFESPTAIAMVLENGKDWESVQTEINRWKVHIEISKMSKERRKRIRTNFDNPTPYYAQLKMRWKSGPRYPKDK